MMTTKLPSKPELLQGELVDFTANHKRVATNTLKITDALGKRHHDITRKVDSLVSNGLIDKRELSLIYFVDSAGRKQKTYELNEEAALQVVMGSSGSKAKQLHKEIAQAFVRMKSELHDWRTERYLASDSTKLANDSIYRLQAEMAKTIPSSMRCTKIYIHFQQAMTKAVTGSAKTKRDMMTANQLYQMAQLEQKVHDQFERLRLEGEEAVRIRDDVLDWIKQIDVKEAQTTNDQANEKGFKTNVDNQTFIENHPLPALNIGASNYA